MTAPFRSSVENTEVFASCSEILQTASLEIFVVFGVLCDKVICIRLVESDNRRSTIGNAI